MSADTVVVLPEELADLASEYAMAVSAHEYWSPGMPTGRELPKSRAVSDRSAGRSVRKSSEAPIWEYRVFVAKYTMRARR